MFYNPELKNYKRKDNKFRKLCYSLTTYLKNNSTGASAVAYWVKLLSMVLAC